LSIVIPCYNEEAVLPATFTILIKELRTLEESGLIDAESRIYCVDDGSNDSTWEIISGYSDYEKKIEGIKLANNVGHQNALMAGLMTVPGDIIISIDADLQDDIKVMRKMILEYKKGSDIVFGVRKRRDSDAFFKRNSALAFYRFLSLLGVKIIENHADFRLMSRKALENLRQFSEVNLFLRGIVPLVGLRSSNVYYDRSERLAGETKYTLRKMFALAFEGVTSFSVVPLRVISYIGTIIFIISTCLGLWVLWAKIGSEEIVPGWASTVLPIYFIGGIQILCIGVIGEYMGRIYKEAKRCPRYLIDEITFPM
jgi:glycosyltransferase involved in cell wall biosynthesis